MLKAASPLLVSVTICAPLVVPTVWLEKIKLAGAKLTAGPAATPVPVRLTVFGLSVALSEMLRLPLRVPVAVGVKNTLTVQFAPAATLVPQLFVCVKSPLAVILEIVSAPLPLLVKVTVCAALVVPMDWLPNVTVVELTEMPAVKTGTSAVLPPPPQDTDIMTIAMQAVARITAVPRSGSSASIFMRGRFKALVLPNSCQVPSPGDQDAPSALPGSGEFGVHVVFRTKAATPRLCLVARR